MGYELARFRGADKSHGAECQARHNLRSRMAPNGNGSAACASYLLAMEKRAAKLECVWRPNERQ
jgi:hypothetical protein